MASDFPRSPKLLKGALVAYESAFFGPIPNIIVFQYNPAELSRTLTQRSPSSDGKDGAARSDANRVSGPPKESISMTVELHAADQLEQPATHPHTVVFGLHPALAALELLLYPSSEQFLLGGVLANAGTAQITPPNLPIVLLVWGASRVVPVRLSSFSITEQAFDNLLNPIQAQVQLGMDILTYMDLEAGTLGHDAYVVHQIQKEVLARLNLLNSAEQIVGMLSF